MTVYDDVALEIKDAIRHDLFSSDQFDQKAVVEVLERNFNMSYQAAGKMFLDSINMFNRDTGFIVSDIPGIYMTVFLVYGYEPIIPGRIHPNYDISNRYVGYTKDGIFRRMQYFDIKTRTAKFLKERLDIIVIILLIFIVVTASMLGMI